MHQVNSISGTDSESIYIKLYNQIPNSFIMWIFLCKTGTYFIMFLHFRHLEIMETAYNTQHSDI